MVDSGNLHSMVDVVDDARPVDAREFALFHIFAGDPVAFDQLATFLVAAALMDFDGNGWLILGSARSALRNSWLRTPRGS